MKILQTVSYKNIIRMARQGKKIILCSQRIRIARRQSIIRNNPSCFQVKIFYFTANKQNNTNLKKCKFCFKMFPSSRYLSFDNDYTSFKSQQEIEYDTKWGKETTCTLIFHRSKIRVIRFFWSFFSSQPLTARYYK